MLFPCFFLLYLFLLRFFLLFPFLFSTFSSFSYLHNAFPCFYFSHLSFYSVLPCFSIYSFTFSPISTLFPSFSPFPTFMRSSCCSPLISLFPAFFSFPCCFIISFLAFLHLFRFFLPFLSTSFSLSIPHTFLFFCTFS